MLDKPTQKPSIKKVFEEEEDIIEEVLPDVEASTSSPSYKLTKLKSLKTLEGKIIKKDNKKPLD